MSRSSKATSSSAAASVDASQHPGYANLGNTCFVNSTLQAIAATQSLKELYQPGEETLLQQRRFFEFLNAISDGVQSPDPTPVTTPAASRRPSLVSDLADARCKSPVLRLADEEHGHRWYKTISRPPSISIEAASIRALAGQAVANPTPADIQTLQRAEHNGNSNGEPAAAPFEPQASDIPLNTAFRRVLEKSWDPANRKGSTAKTLVKPSKVASISPKPLLKEMSAKYEQYGEYRQQDSHELLRHLLDSLRMEEMDVIKKLRPPPKGKTGVRRRKASAIGNQAPAQGQAEHRPDELRPFVDNIFCGKLLSCVVCEGCRHVSHTYEDFYDISLSLRPDSAGKEAGKRQRIRTMADRWRKGATGKSKSGTGNASETSNPLAESLAILRDGNVGSYSDTEPGDEMIRRAHSRAGRGIVRPQSAADHARIDANSKEGAKTFLRRYMEGTTDASDTETGPEKAMEELSLDDGGRRRREPSGQLGASLLRAVSGRRTPVSRAASPLRRDVRETATSPSESGQEEKGLDQPAHRHHHHWHHAASHRHKKPSRHSRYITRLLTEASPQVQQPNLSALFWGRSRTPTVPDIGGEGGSMTKRDVPVEGIEEQQANTGLVRALYQFTAVEVLDGANSFACKRCWRLQNPPSAEEAERLRLRRLRRGKAADESEDSSDDDSSSDEERKMERQRHELANTSQQQTPAVVTASLSSTASLSDGTSTDPAADLSSDVSHSTGPSMPALVVVSEPQNNLDTPTLESTRRPFTRSQAVIEKANGADDEGEEEVLVGTPTLRAPRPVLASASGLRLSRTSSIPSSEDDGAASSSDTNSDDDSDEARIRIGTTDPRPLSTAVDSNQGVSTITKPAVLPGRNTVSGKRAAHSIPRRALKRFMVAETPKVFVFHFKRFQATGRGFSFASSFKKIDDYVTFPEFLDVTPWLAPPREEYDRRGRLKASSDPRALAQAQREAEAEAAEGKASHHHWGWRPHHHHHTDKAPIAEAGQGAPKTQYRLYAVVVHQGSMSGGHYTAYVLSDRASETLQAKAKRQASLTDLAQTKASSTVTLPKERGSKERLTPNEPGSGSAMVTAITSRAGSTSSTTSPTTASQDGSSVGATAIRMDALGSVSSLGSDLGGPGGAASDTSADGGSVAPTTTSPPPARSWIYASDTLVKPATIEEVLKAQAYMLFYEQM